MKKYLNFILEGLKTAKETFLKNKKDDLEFFTNKLLPLDHTTTKKYMDYIVKQYLKNNDIDLNQLKHYLTEFDKHNKSLDNPVYFTDEETNKGVYTNINYKKYDDFEFLKKVLDHKTKTKSSEIKKAKETFKTKKKVIYEDDRFIIANPESHQESCQYAQGAKWCISMKKNNQHWQSYTDNKDVNFYFIRDKKYNIGEQYSNIAVAVMPEHYWEKLKNRGLPIYDAYDYNDHPIKDFEKYAKENGIKIELFKPVDLNNLPIDKKLTKNIELNEKELRSIDLINTKSIIYKVRGIILGDLEKETLNECIDKDFEEKYIAEINIYGIEIEMDKKEYLENYSEYSETIYDELESQSSKYSDYSSNDNRLDYDQYYYYMNNENIKKLFLIMDVYDYETGLDDENRVEEIGRFIQNYELNKLFWDFLSELDNGIENSKRVKAKELLDEITFKFVENDYYNKHYRKEGKIVLKHYDLFKFLYEKAHFNLEKLTDLMKLNLNGEEVNDDSVYEELGQAEYNIDQSYIEEANKRLEKDLDKYIENDLDEEVIKKIKKFEKIKKELKFDNELKLKTEDKEIRITNINFKDEKVTLKIRTKNKLDEYDCTFDEIADHIQQYKLELAGFKYIQTYKQYRT